METSNWNHWDKFAEFCLWEINSGGPDPQIPLVAEMSKNEIWIEKVWRAGVYVSVYNVPFAEMIWNKWSYMELQNNQDELFPWLQNNWPKIVTRFERRTVRRPEWMYEYLKSYFDFLNRGVFDQAIQHTGSMSPEERYIYFWDLTIKDLKRFGRYVALKLLESYRLYCDINLIAPDIRPEGGWSPRVTLGELFPSYTNQMNSKDNRYNPVVNQLVEEALKMLWNGYGIQMDKFKLQVMLCEYRESYHGKKQYPGRSHDSELGYYNKAQELWDKPASRVLEARKAIFPHEHLGELNSWEGPRKACGQVLSQYGYTWTDLLYDYQASWMDMSKPIWRLFLPEYKA